MANAWLGTTCCWSAYAASAVMHSNFISWTTQALAMTNLMRICSVSTACALALLSGCTWLMRSDFDNGREVAALEIGKAQSVTKAMDFPPGDASISFVVPGYDCKRPLDGTIDFVIRGAKGVIKQETVSLSKLTWPRQEGGCLPIGYLRLDDENLSQPLSFHLDGNENPITINLDIKQPASVGRSMSVWVVYNSRLPIERMLGKLKVSGPS